MKKKEIENPFLGLFDAPKYGPSREGKPHVGVTLKEIVRNEVTKRYQLLRYDKTATAKSLGISRATIYRMLNEWGVR